MSGKQIQLSLLFLVIGLSACSSAKPVPRPLPTLTDEWTIKFTQSGGFAGVLLTLEISSEGRFKAQDQRAGKNVDQSLSPEMIGQLTALIAGLRVSPDAGTSPGCADCFIYELEIHSGGSVSKTRVDDVTIGRSGVEELITFLRRLRNGALGISY
jgi:hypothetical protein